MGIEALMGGLVLQMAQQQGLAQQGLSGGLQNIIDNPQLGMAATSTGERSTATTDNYTLLAWSGGEPQKLWTPRNRTFYRINQKIELREGEEIKEPLDELRIEVAKWLN